MSDAMAIGAMQRAPRARPGRPGRRQRRRLRRHRPGPHVDPPLTTVHQPIRQKGEEAVRAAARRRRAARTAPSGRASPARDAARRPCSTARSSGAGPDRREVTVDTPAWVRDAIFYQIFPDRFAAQRAGPQAGRPRAVGRAADRSRVQGRRPARDRRAPRLPRGPRDHRDLPDPDLQLRPRTTATTRTTTSRSIRCSAAMTRCASCSTPHTDAGCASCSMASSTTPGAASSRSTTCWRPGRRRRTGTGSTSTRALDAGPAAARLPAARDAAVRVRLQGLVGPAGPAQAQHRQPRGPRVPDDRRGVLAPLRDRRLAARRARRDRRRGVLAGVPPPLPGDPPGCLPRRRDLAGGTRVAARRPLRRADELPARRGDPGLRRRLHTSTWRSSPPTTNTGLWVRPLDGPAFADTGDRARERLRPRRRRRPAQRRRLARRAAAADRARRRCATGAPGDAAPGDAARRAIDLLRRRGRADGRPRPDCRGGIPVGRGPLGAGSARFGAGAPAPASRGARAARRAASRGAARPARPSPSSAARERRISSSRSTPGTMPARLDIRLEGRGRRRRAPRAGRPPRSRRHRRPALSRTAVRHSSFRRAPVPSCASAEDHRRISVILRACGRSPDRTRGRARRAIGPHPRCRGEDPADVRCTGSCRGARRAAARWRRLGSARDN